MHTYETKPSLIKGLFVEIVIFNMKAESKQVQRRIIIENIEGTERVPFFLRIVTIMF